MSNTGLIADVPSVLQNDVVDEVSPTSERQRQINVWADFNVFLGDEFIGYRLKWEEDEGRLHVRRIDSEVLHREIVDRTFQITRDPEFVAADEHYSQAWKHYSKVTRPRAA